MLSLSSVSLLHWHISSRALHCELMPSGCVLYTMTRREGL
jgi:hypothetical protein